MIQKGWETNLFEREEQFQAAAIKMISQQFPRLRDKVFHPKNEGYIPKLEGEDDDAYEKRKMREGNRNKANGMLAGVMDIIIVHNGIRYGLELKLPKRYLSDDQKKIHAVWDKDCPLVPIVTLRTLLEIYLYCEKILKTNLRIGDATFEEFFGFVDWWDTNVKVAMCLYTNKEKIHYYHLYKAT